MGHAFANRAEAGRLLARRIAQLHLARPLIYALPRGGVPVGCEIARALNAPLDLIFVRKIGVPSQPELAAGAIVDGETPTAVWNEDVLNALNLRPQDLSSTLEAERAVIARRRALYLKDAAPISPQGREAVIVDDGVATGASMRAAIKAMRARNPSRIIVAAPVAAHEAAATLSALADEVVCLRTPFYFGAVGLFFEDFSQLSDDDVVALLAGAAHS